MFSPSVNRTFLSFARLVKKTTPREHACKDVIGSLCKELPAVGLVRYFRHNPLKYPRPKPFYYPEIPEHQETIKDTTEEDEKTTKEVISKVNSQISGHSHGRLFAVVHVSGVQYKITQGDLICVEGYWAPQPGDQIRLEKVVLVGSSDFTLIGRPLLMPDLVRITATIVDKSLEPTRYYFRYRPREQKKTSFFNRAHITTLRINTIQITSLLDEHREVEGLKGRIF